MNQVIKYSVYANSGLFTCDDAKIFHASRQTAVSSFFASLIAFMTLCYISRVFLPRRQRKFGDSKPNCVNQYDHFI